MFDLVMWAKNGSRTLAPVLRRINQVIPRVLIGKRILVDDSSSDNTCDIARRFFWKPVPNRGQGISDAANTALSHVISPFFISFEQDLLLSTDWFTRIPRMVRGNVIIASGVRIPCYPKSLVKLQEYTLEKYAEHKTLAHTLDNTMYRTQDLINLGGFPKQSKDKAGLDIELYRRVKQAGFQWLVDYGLRSLHLRKGISQELRHAFWYGKSMRKPLKCLRLFLTSPLRGLLIAWRMKSASCLPLYCRIRYQFWKGSRSY